MNRHKWVLGAIAILMYAVNGAWADSISEMAILSALERNDTPEELKEIVKNKHANLFHLPYKKKTYLHIAAKVSKDPKVFKYLIDEGLDVNAVDEEGNTPLHILSERYPDLCKEDVLDGVVKMLIKNKAEIDNNKNQNKYTPLHVAIIRKNIPLIKVLIKNKANINAVTAKDADCLHICIVNQLPIGFAQYLIKNGVDVKHKTNGYTALHTAAIKTYDADLIKLLVESGLDINAKDAIDGWTPLHAAAWFNNNLKVLRTIIELGADVNATTKTGATPLFFAKKHNSASVVRILEEAGAKEFVKQPAGNSKNQSRKTASTNTKPEKDSTTTTEKKDRNAARYKITLADGKEYLARSYIKTQNDLIIVMPDGTKVEDFVSRIKSVERIY